MNIGLVFLILAVIIALSLLAIWLVAALDNSNYIHSKKHKGPKPVDEQIMAIANTFKLNPASALEFAANLPPLESFVSKDALPWVGWFAIPSVEALAAEYFPEIADPAEKYCAAVRLVLAKIGASRSFYNHYNDQINPEYLRVHERTAQFETEIAKTQKGDIQIIAAQFGMYHRGRSVRQARAVFAKNEFGLGVLAGGSIILTHPEGFLSPDELYMECSGDEFVSKEGGIVIVPSFVYYERSDIVGLGMTSYIEDKKELKFEALNVDSSRDCFGSASAFVP